MKVSSSGGGRSDCVS